MRVAAELCDTVLLLLLGMNGYGDLISDLLTQDGGNYHR
jgi:hypothetical protein